MKAIWNGQILAESDKTVIIENNHYFPADSVNMEFFKTSDYHTVCPWKGTASYHSIEMNGETNKDAMWHYPQTKDSAKVIEGMFAFWKGVIISEMKKHETKHQNISALFAQPQRPLRLKTSI